MNEMKEVLLKTAVDKYQKIFPCENKMSFSECYTTIGNQLLFWFNTEDKSTHVVARKCN